MARLPRLIVPGCPHHLIQRGVRGQALFHDATDFEFMTALLGEYGARDHVSIHSYALTDNTIEFLATPATADGLSALMQAVGRRYVQRFNLRHARSGALWEGRFRAAPLQASTYLIPCTVYIDMSPVRAGLVARPMDYPWSSHGHYIGLRRDALVTPHEAYWRLGNTPFAREASYARLVAEGISVHQQQVISDSTLKGWALGDAEFQADVGSQTGRRATRRRPGRPRSKPL